MVSENVEVEWGHQHSMSVPSKTRVIRAESPVSETENAFEVGHRLYLAPRQRRVDGLGGRATSSRLSR